MTTCIWFQLDDTFHILTRAFAWDDPYDRAGDGDAELDSFVQVSRDNGFTVVPVDQEDYDGCLPKYTEVYRFANDFESGYFGLLVVPTDEALTHLVG